MALLDFLQSAAQPLPEVNEYEQERINHVLENRAKFKELGLDKYMPPLKIPTIRIRERSKTNRNLMMNISWKMKAKKKVMMHRRYTI